MGRTYQMKVLVCGGRAYADHAAIFDALDTVDRRRPIKAIIEGGESGADAIARDWAESRRVRLRSFSGVEADDEESRWSKRNQQMLDEGRPDLIIAFPGARRTADMIDRARAAGVTVLEVGG